ncbi:MerR family transcriptional regulator [Paenibacillus sp. SYP-B3998]|uniref:MerR family transcriptional regulator n=1 Tax=Paenibacillus sp. SYP-B3998 TaxID=2678564 RepID=A0A6G4A675_9BACL|nr:MerR family transcriptional regulator [Paenibacillus sp. SYP-B3998]NEW09309.1 MerR family transcriptional regulator [Paenibacillus sp. SYP-B3998]
MSAYITISELSKLMNVSVHQVRYFEEKEILYPAYIDHNQYRMYGISEIYQLSQILLLRKLNISVKQIKECMISYSANDYSQLFTKTLKDIQSEIDQLMILKDFIQKVLTEHNASHNNPENHYHMKYFDTRHMTQWIQLGEEEQINARNLYEKRLKLPNLFESDLHYLYAYNRISICFESVRSADLKLEQGNYLIKNFIVTGDNDILEEIKKLQQYIQENQYSYAGEIIIIEKSYLSMFSNNSLLYEIQVKISD